MTIKQKTDLILERDHHRGEFYRLAIMMIATAAMRGLRLIMENPWSENTYLKGNFILPPAYVDKNSTLRGDHFIKPTAYWFINCEPTNLTTYQNNKQVKRVLDIKSSNVAGICSEERSMISPDYARNFICDLIIGKPQRHTQLSLFS